MTTSEFDRLWESVRRVIVTEAVEAAEGDKKLRKALKKASPYANTAFQVVRDIVSSDAFADLLRYLVNDPPSESPLAAVARSYQERNVPVTVMTAAGSVDGFIIAVGTDVVVLRQSQGAEVVFNLSNTYAIQPQGTE